MLSITCTCQGDSDDHIFRAGLGERLLQILQKQAVPFDFPADNSGDPDVLQQRRLAPSSSVHRVHVQRVIEARFKTVQLKVRPWISLLIYRRHLADRSLIALRRVQRRRVRLNDGDVPRDASHLEQKVLRRATVLAGDAIHLQRVGLIVQRTIERRLRWLCKRGSERFVTIRGSDWLSEMIFEIDFVDESTAILCWDTSSNLNDCVESGSVKFRGSTLSCFELSV